MINIVTNNPEILYNNIINKYFFLLEINKIINNYNFINILLLILYKSILYK